MKNHVMWITHNGKKDKEHRRVVPIINGLYVKLLKEFRISRFIPLLLVDEPSWTYKGGLNMNPRSVAHYNEGIKFGLHKPHEAILLRECVLKWDDAQTEVPKILRHELVHAKLKGKEKGNNHGSDFKKVAKKFGNIAGNY
jgi:hypothetical protein